MAHMSCLSGRSHQPPSRPAGKQFWHWQLLGGLPENFSYAAIRSNADARDLILALPKCDRGRAARELCERRNEVGAENAYAGVMVAWDHDHRNVIESFGSAKRFAAVLRTIAPRQHAISHRRSDIWRGALLHESKLVAHAISISWTRSRAIACWFALRNYVPVLQPHLIPIVLHANVANSSIITWHDARAEQEVIVDSIDLIRKGAIGVDLIGAPIIHRRLADLKADDCTYCDKITSWRYASDRYQHWKDLFESRRICAHHQLSAMSD